MDTSTETAPMATAGDSGYDISRDPGRTMGGTSGDTSHIHPLDGLDDEPGRTGAEPVAPPVAAEPTGRKTRSVGSNRHLTSVVLALVAVPAGYGFTDYAVTRAVALVDQQADPGRLPDRLIVMLAAAAACFLLAALAGRISALGPLFAGLVWGAAPAAWVILDYPSYIDRLNDLPEFWTHTGFGLATAGFVLFPAVAGLLLAGTVTGRWRRPVPVSRW